MPLLDHFHPPLSARRHWEGFHSRWASAIADQLNEQLPAGYFAEPTVHYGTRIEADVAAFEEPPTAERHEAGVGTLVWSPPRPTTTVPLPAADYDRFEVQVFSDEAGPRLVAAVELVSPGNKDRPDQRTAFAVKCAAYIQQGVSLAVIDVVTARRANLHDELLRAAQWPADAAANPHELYAAAYRIAAGTSGAVLEIWLEALSVGADLPTLPLWINPTDAIPVDLADSYASTCRVLKIDKPTTD